MGCSRAIVFIAALLVGGCSSWSPEDDARVYKGSYQLTPDGYYRVRRGDTLHAIAFNFGLDWRDIAAWNSIRAPYVIYPDQELRLDNPRRSSGSKSAGTKPSSGAAANKTPSTPAGKSTSSASSRQASDRSSAGKSSSSDTPSSWLWPTEGRIVSNFKANDPARNGIEIGGKEGQAVKATAAGEVVYSGNGLIGYGELIIVKHSEQMLSAYGHNRKRLVKEGQRVRAGDRIAEMGRNERNQAILHFEIRHNGTPRNPLTYLPRR
jgi:lipoprotein NlpD